MFSFDYENGYSHFYVKCFNAFARVRRTKSYYHVRRDNYEDCHITQWFCWSYTALVMIVKVVERDKGTYFCVMLANDVWNCSATTRRHIANFCEVVRKAFPTFNVTYAWLKDKVNSELVQRFERGMFSTDTCDVYLRVKPECDLVAINREYEAPEPICSTDFGNI